MPGKLRQVLVDEGDHVHRGQVIAVLNNDDYTARILTQRAEIEMREAELRRVVNGSRQQERGEAQASIREAEAVMANARAEKERRESLFRTGDISRSDFERAEREYNVAKARYDARRPASLVRRCRRSRRGPRTRPGVTRISPAPNCREAEALLAKTVHPRPHGRRDSPTPSARGRDRLRANPIRPSSPWPTTPSCASAWTSTRPTSRAVAVGQAAWFTADAFGDRKFPGHVVRVGGELGRKRVRTDEPTERVDTKILETLDATRRSSTTARRIAGRLLHPDQRRHQMKPRLPVVLLLAARAWSARPRRHHRFPHLTLDDAVAMALRDNLDVRIERTNVSSAQQAEARRSRLLRPASSRWTPQFQVLNTPSPSVLSGENGKLSEHDHTDSVGLHQRAWQGAALRPQLR